MVYAPTIPYLYGMLQTRETRAPFKTTLKNGKKFIFDVARQKYVSLTPEEWVRQNFLKYLIEEKKYPIGLLGVEIALKINGMSRRADIIAYNRLGKPILIVECKAPAVNITQSEFDQAAMYNMRLKVDYLIITNGLNHYCCKVKVDEKKYEFLQQVPYFDDL